MEKAARTSGIKKPDITTLHLQCDTIRKLHPEIRHAECCPECHADFDKGEDYLWFMIGDELKHVCCGVMTAYWRKHGD